MRAVAKGGSLCRRQSEEFFTTEGEERVLFWERLPGEKAFAGHEAGRVFTTEKL